MKLSSPAVVLLSTSLSLLLVQCARTDGRDGIDKLGNGGGEFLVPSSGNGSYSPGGGSTNGTGNTTSYQPKRYQSKSGASGATTGGTVHFVIKKGTGNGPWNSQADILKLSMGQTLIIDNQDTVPHRLHTDGAPCPHGEDIAPGDSGECNLGSVYDSSASGPLHDHDYGDQASFWIQVSDAAPQEETSKPSVGTRLSDDAYQAQIAPIVTRSCGGASCHGAGSYNPIFVDDRKAFDGFGDKVVTSITSSVASETMPPPTSGRVLSEADKQALLDYFR